MCNIYVKIVSSESVCGMLGYSATFLAFAYTFICSYLKICSFAGLEARANLFVITLQLHWFVGGTYGSNQSELPYLFDISFIC